MKAGQQLDVILNYNSLYKLNPETAKYLGEEYHLSGWWSQVVTVRYEKEKSTGKELNKSLF